jgi:inorganic pyrophosphatase
VIQPRLSLETLPAYDDEKHLLVVIEAAPGSRNKLKYERSFGVLVLHKVLPLGTAFPYAFGFVPSTRGGDGDPLDVLVLMEEAVAPGVVVPCRLVGVIEARQRSGRKSERNDRLIAVAAGSLAFRECRALSDVPQDMLEGIERFFVFYRREEGVAFEPIARHGRRRAAQLVEAGRRAFRRG